MRILLFLIWFTFLSNVWAQVRTNEKWSKTSYNQDSSLVHLSDGQKSTLIHLNTNEPVFKKSKAPILQFPERDWYVKISKKNVILYDNSTNSYKELAQFTDVINGFGIRRIYADTYLVTDYGKPDYDSSGYVQFGFQKSGIYHAEGQRWLIPNEYKELYLIGDFWLCKKDDSISTKFPDEEYFELQKELHVSYDIYRQTGNEINLVGAQITDNQTAYDLIFEDDLFDQNRNYLTIREDALFGVIALDLFSLDEDGYPLIDHDTILPIIYDFVQVSSDQSAIALKDNQGQMRFTQWNSELNDFNEPSKANNPFIMAKMNYGSWKEHSSEFESTYYGDTFFKMGLSQRQDQDLIVINETISYPFQKIDEFGEPMYDWETEQMIYEEGGEVKAKSGVYSSTKEQWLLQPEYGEIKMLPNGYLVNRYKSDYISGDNGKFDDQWCVYNFSGKLVEELEDSSFFVQLSKTVAGPSAKKMDTPVKMTSQYSADHLALFRDTSSMKLISKADDFYAPYEIFESDFIYSATPRKYWFAIDTSGNWLFHLNEEEIQIEWSEQINLIIESPQGSECFEVSRVMNNDTVLISKEQIQQCSGNSSAAYLQIQQLPNGDLLVNDAFKFEEVRYDYWGEFDMEYYEETESSAIWSKSDKNQWLRVTPFYASLEKAGAVFIAKTAACSGNFVYQEGDEFVLTDQYGYPKLEGGKAARYFLLDSCYKAISLMDYYDFIEIEDLGFGLSLTTDKGKMFVDYSAKAITTDEWDQFSLENGKLKAVRDAVYEYDEFGEPAMDDNFELIIARKAKEAFYELNQDR